MPTLEWVAVFQATDGTLHTYRQPSADPSEGFPQALELQEKEQLLSFHLDFTEKQRSIGVDLKTGHYLFSGFFRHHPAPNLAKMNPTYRLINFRRRYRDKGVGVEYDSGIQLAYYILGWQTTIRAKNYQRMMFIDPNTLEIKFEEKR